MFIYDYSETNSSKIPNPKQKRVNDWIKKRELLNIPLWHGFDDEDDED